MNARVGYVVGALLLGAGAFFGFQFSGATFSDDSRLPADVTAARDWTPPTVSVDDPGFVISGIVSITATAGDRDTSVATVEIQYRSVSSDRWTSLCVASTSPWACTWDTYDVDDGSFELRAIATDIDGNLDTSATVVTEVKNSRGVVIDPVPSPTRGTVQLTAHLVNVNGVANSITFQVSDATPNGWLDLPGCTDLAGTEGTCAFDTTRALDGVYDLRVVGRDGRRSFYDFQRGIEVDNTAPSVTIDQASDQADPSGAGPVYFTAVFSEPVSDFDASDVTVGGTVGGARAVTVTGSGRTYSVSVGDLAETGTLTVEIAAGRVHDAAGNDSQASTSLDNQVTVDAVVPTVTVEQASSQADPTRSGPVDFTVVFSKPVTGFTEGDVSVGGSAAGAASATVTGSGTTYNVAVSGMADSGTVTVSVPAGGANDSVGNPNDASTSVDNTVDYDVTAPSVTIDRAADQASPTNGSPVAFSVEFSEPVTRFTRADVTITGTATGASTVTVSGSGSSYVVRVSGMSSDGTVIASVGANRAVDLAGNGNSASTSTDNTVVYDVTAPSVTLDQAQGQADPTLASPINFTVVFSEPVTDFTAGDVELTGTATGGTVDVTGSGASYTVAVSAMTSDGTVIASVPAGGVSDAAGNANVVSTSTDNTVTYDGTRPSVTINQAQGQPDPTNTSPINFTVVFSEPVSGFTGSDVNVTGTAIGTKTVTLTGSGPTYNVAVSGMTADGTVLVSVPANRVVDPSGNTNTGSTSTDRKVTYDATAPSVTIDQAGSQADPANGSTIDFTVVFSESVTGFTSGDVDVTGTAGGTTSVTVTGSGTTYNVAVSGMTSDGSVIASVPAGGASDTAGNTNNVATSTDATVTWDGTKPTVTINQAGSQADPTTTSPIDFTVVFSEPVTGFDSAGDLSFTGTAGGAMTGTITGSGTTYNVAVSGMTDGTVIASVLAGGASDAAGNTNAVSTSTDATVTYDTTRPTVTIDQAGAQADPTATSPINFAVVFSEPVSGFSSANVAITGAAGGTKAVTVTGSGTTYNVAVSGMTSDGTVVAAVTAGGASDAAGNTNVASTSTDATVTWDTTRPTVTINQAGSQADPTRTSPINFTVVFNEQVTGFDAAGDVTITGGAGGAKTVNITGSGTTYNVAVSGMTTSGTVVVAVPAGGASDAAGNTNVGSTSTDATVTWDVTGPAPTIVRASGQGPTTTTAPINYTVTFNEPVTGFDAAGDVTITGSAGGTKTTSITGSGTTYNVAVSGMTSDGTVIAAIPAGAAADSLGNTSTASGGTQASRTVTWDDSTAPSVTVNQAATQVDPTKASPVNFTVVFSEPVNGFINTDVSVGGTAGGTKTVVVTGTGPTYNVAVSGMTSTGTVTASVGAATVTDVGGRANSASTSTDNSVTFTFCGSATLTATADAWIDQAASAQNNGTATSLSVLSKTGSANARALVKFTLPAMPAGCSVTAATLKLNNTVPTSGRTIDVVRVNAAWAEGTVTYANQPATTGTAVGSTAPAAAGIQQWTVTSIVQSHYSVANNGFLLRDRTESGAGAGFKQSYQSRESGGTLPTLVITWG